MKRKITILFLFLFVLCSYISAAEENRILNWQIELDQMMQLRLGVTWNINDYWGFRGSLGAAPFGITTWSYNLMGIYHFSIPRQWEVDMEFGLPLGYFNFIEGRYVDWDPIIDDPFAGWLFGASLRAGYRFNFGMIGLRLGGAWWMEYQQDSGWKDPGIMPIVAAFYELN